MDKCTGYLSIIPLVHKSEVLKHFITYHAWLEKQLEFDMKRVHSEIGGEYMALGITLPEKGIERTDSSSFSPNMNRVPERANRNILECAGTILEHKSLSKTF